MIPLVDLNKQYQQIRKEVDLAISKVMKKGDFILGEEVLGFEEEFARYIGVKYCVGVASGTDAILLSLKSLGIGPGDEVISVANTFISTILPIIYLGAKPVLVDADPVNYQININRIEAVITKKTKAIIPVHLYGYPAPIKKILSLIKGKNIVVVEDACQAHGSKIDNKKCGSFSKIAAFSFYPGKNLGAVGDAGMIATNDKKLFEMISALRNIGQYKKYEHDLLGYNSRLDTINAAVLSAKLPFIDGWNKKRNIVANLYRKYLADCPVVLPPEPDKGLFANYHLFVIRAPKRDELLMYLKEKKVYCGIHYPIPIHLQKCMSVFGYKRGDFPIAEKLSRQVLSLPMFPELTEREVKFICKNIYQFYKNG